MAEIPEASNPQERNEDDVSKDADDWESDWNDYGKLPTFIPDFNVALSDYIIKKGGVKASFPEGLRKEGGVRSIEHFIKVFTSSFTMILDLLGGRVSTTHQKDIV
jgi:hypothetical protein